MCLEIYAPGQQIEIPYIHEEIEFLGPNAICGTYAILVRNLAALPIQRLCWLYPRSLWEFDADGNGVVSNVLDITEDLPDGLGFTSKLVGEELSFDIPDPNDPDRSAPNIKGRLAPDNFQFSNPQGFGPRHAAVMKTHNLTGIYVEFSEPLRFGEGHWFWWQIKTERVGTSIANSLIGPHVFHYFASPLLVYRTVRETYLAGIRDFDVFNDRQLEHLPVYNSTIDMFGLDKERKVDIRYHHFALKPGDPKKRVLQFLDSHGDLRMYTGSPEIVDGEPVFGWKSGDHLIPQHPVSWRDEGFRLRVMMRYQ